MRLKVLGSAAGGGFPQWNCGCVNCSRVREGRFPGAARTQAQLAWSAAADQWTLIGASPDLLTQIQSTPELWPPKGTRDSPIRNVLLLSAEVDQTLGLLSLREFHSFRVYATSSARKILTEDNTVFGVLARYAGQVCWEDIVPGRAFSVDGARLEPVPLRGFFPGFVSASRATKLNSAEAVIGVLLSPEAGGATAAFLPGVAEISDALRERLENCDILLFDGTFWSDSEPLEIPGITRTARQIGHVPISGPGGTLESLAALRRPRKIFIHINNTNPILDEESWQYRMVREAGWEVARDGMEFTL
jgi:pyrroloquinoline quinone biosynthesis protein B